MQYERQRVDQSNPPIAEQGDVFQTKSRASLIEQVTGEMFAGCNVLTIRGCRGVGKTHLARHLSSQLRSHGRLVIPVSGAVHDLAQVQDFIARVRSPSATAGGRCTDRLILFVDDAKACPAALFAYLWSLVAGRDTGAPVIQLILLGDVGPWPGLNDPALQDLREASTSCYILAPFEEDEAAAYLRHKCEAAGWTRRRLMSRSAMRDLVGQSHGVPAVLDVLVVDAIVRGERLRRKRDPAPAGRQTGRAGWTPPRPAIALAAMIAMAITLAASAFAPRTNTVALQIPGAISLLSSARLRPAQLAVYTPLARLPVETSLATTPGPALPAPGRAGPGLVLVASAGDDLRVLYDKVYRGLTPPPYLVVLAVNPSPVRPGGLVIFPEPPGGWSLPRLGRS